MRVIRKVVVVLAVLAVGACHSSSGDQAVLRATATGPPTGAPLPTKCCVPPNEPALDISVTPTSGPPGTVVHILVTGCGEADPANLPPTVSFNNDAENFGSRNDPDTVRRIAVQVRGTRVTGTYPIVPRDRTGGVGMFFAQCGQSLEQTRFRVTG
ncbi:MAG TPA: hypothetical protein VFJ17_00225 [Mycobacteriales bacterium]|nr:hypothetical protein [Mycobacteriales bacterium]